MGGIYLKCCSCIQPSCLVILVGWTVKTDKSDISTNKRIICDPFQGAIVAGLEASLHAIVLVMLAPPYLLARPDFQIRHRTASFSSDIPP